MPPRPAALPHFERSADSLKAETAGNPVSQTRSGRLRRTEVLARLAGRALAGLFAFFHCRQPLHPIAALQLRPFGG